MNKRDKRDKGWTLDSQVGPRGGGATSDGKRWRRLDEAAEDARNAVERVFGADIQRDDES